MSFKILLGSSATVLSFLSYIPYIKDILKGKTKPHAFSWLVWSILTGIGFFGQLADNAGSGAWVTGSTALLCFIVFLLALRKGEKNITLLDWLSLLGAIIALENFTVVTSLFPISLVVTNGLFVVMLVIRRKQLGILVWK